MKNLTISIKKIAGTFAENKDVARDIRNTTLKPALSNGSNITLDFSGVDGVTQSFVHALISELIRNFGPGVLDRIDFKDCNLAVQNIILIVSDYMQESDDY